MVRRSDSYKYRLISPFVALVIVISSQVHAGDSLTFADRVSAQRAIERVYYEHRIWPIDNSEPKPSFEQMMPEDVLRRKVEDPLRMSIALEDLYLVTITSIDLQAEMDRMAGETRDPVMLKELFSALGNDPRLIAECLARPLLADRLLRERFASDEEFLAPVRAIAKEARAAVIQPEDVRTAGDFQVEIHWLKEDLAGQPSVDRFPSGFQEIPVDVPEWDSLMTLLSKEWGARGNLLHDLDGADWISPMREEADRFCITAILMNRSDALWTLTASWMKKSFDSWWSEESGRFPLTIIETDSAYRFPEIPSTRSGDSWSATDEGTNCPTARWQHIAVWTGAEMVVWGGINGTSYYNTGGRYYPATNSWLATSLGTNCPSVRTLHTGTWSGTEVWIWSGTNGSNDIDDGGRYNPATNTWLTIPATGLPEVLPRHGHRAAGGSVMFVYGGYFGTQELAHGASYCLASSPWEAIPGTGGPGARADFTFTSFSLGVIVWGGDYSNTGAKWIYEHEPRYWETMTTTGAPTARSFHSAVFFYDFEDFRNLLIWGGSTPSVTNTGAIYVANYIGWTPISTGANVPSARAGHTAVGDIGNRLMIVWGGSLSGGAKTNTGGIYITNDDRWEAMSTSGAPPARSNHTAVWTSSKMIIWGGLDGSSSPLKSGGIYSPCVEPQTFGDSTINDPDRCTAGLRVSWNDVGIFWDDYDENPSARTIDILRNGSPLVTGLPWSTSYTDTTVVGGQSYSYEVRFNNSCGSSTTIAPTGYMIEHPYNPLLDGVNNTAADVDACADSGVLITWPRDASDWGDDGNTAARQYMVYRGGSSIGSSIPYGTTSYTDTAGVNGNSYPYSVRYINSCGNPSMTAGASAKDYVAASPVGLTNNSATDIDACLDSGVRITWTADPGDWRDNGSGTRSYDVLRDGSAITTGIAYNTTSFIDTTGVNGTSYLYKVRYVNGCGLTTTTGTGASAADLVGTSPANLTNNTAADVSACADSGVLITWTADAGTWNDNGVGTRTYDVLRNGTAIASGIAYNTTAYTDTTGVNETSYTYTVRYNNGCALSTVTTGGAAADKVNTSMEVDAAYNSSTPGWNYYRFASIQAGIDAACTGGAVFVNAGIYPESVTLNKIATVNLIGRLTIDGSLTLSSGTVISSSAVLTLTGNFTNNGGVFNANGGTILLGGTGGQAIGGSTATTFNHLGLNDSLAGYWKLDDALGSVAADSSGNERNGALNGPDWNTTVAPILFANSGTLSFDGVNDLVSTPLAVTADDNVTLSVWTRWVGGLGSSQVIFYNGDATANGYGLYLEVANSYKICVMRIGVGPLYTTSVLPTGGTWRNLILVRRGGTWELYLDGTLLPFTYGNTTASPITPTLGTYIGNSAGLTMGFNGLIDDARVYNRALSVAEITALATGHLPTGYISTTTLGRPLEVNGTLTLSSGNLDVSTGNYSTTVGGDWVHNGGLFTPRSGTVTLDGVNQSLIGEPSFNNLTVVNGDSVTLPLGTMNVTGNWTNNGSVIHHDGTVMFNGASGQTIGGTSGTSFNHMTIAPASGLVGYWKVDEGTGTAASDSSGNDKNGTISQAVWSTTAAPVAFFNPTALSFDGTNDVVNIPLVTTAVDNVTLSAWVRWLGGLAAGQSIVYNGDSGASGYGLFLQQTTGNKITALIGGKVVLLTNATLPTDGTWKNLILVRRSGTWELFINGVQETFTSGSPATAPNTPTGGTYIGNTGTLNSGYNGLIDDVRVYNRALSPTEITAMASQGEAASVTLSRALEVNGNLSLSGGALDVSESNYAIQVAGNWTQSGGAFIPRGGTVFFDGSGTQTITGNTQFTNVNVAGPVTLSTVSDVTVNGLLTNSGWTQETKNLASSGVRAWGLAAVTSNTVTAGTLSNVQIRRRDQNHPDAGSDLQTGKYWSITPTGSGYSVDLTLAHNNLTDPQACRDNAGAWDCARTSFTTTSVTWAGVTAFSDWTVGNQISTPPVGDGLAGTTVATFSKHSGTPLQLDVTYDATHCSSQKAIILYGAMGNFSGYSGCANANAGNGGGATIDSTGLDNVWFNIVWTSGTTAGHPGWALINNSAAERSWNVYGFCGINGDNHNDSSCN